VGGVLAVTLLLKHFSHKEYEQVRNVDNGKTASLLAKMLLLLIMPYPFLHETYVEIETPTLTSYEEIVQSLKLNYLLICLTVFRSCFFVTSVLVRSKYMTPRAERICSMYGAQSGAIYCLRCVFKDSPFAFITTTFLVSVVVFAFLFRISEYQIYSVSSMAMYGNMAWMTVITMTSVGYGDYTPKTPFGRLIGAICVSWGVLIVSVMVVVLTNAFTMNRSTHQFI
jgi:hypothetical protein